jgi:hypothetical protein
MVAGIAGHDQPEEDDDDNEEDEEYYAPERDKAHYNKRVEVDRSFSDLEENLCPTKHLPTQCTREGQYCRRWDDSMGWCRILYDIKGNASMSCEPFEVDRSGYPDWGHFWGGIHEGTILTWVAY